VATTSTLWEANPHTLAKIRIVEEYLKAWFPILAHSRDVTKVNYIDAFSGPGQYTGGEKGSPIVALETALNHKDDLSKTTMNFVFIDKDRERKEHLESLIAGYQPLPEHIHPYCITGTFDAAVTSMLDAADGNQKVLAPTFLFVDPFGISQTPFHVIRRYMANPKCEVMVNLMYQWVNRFKGELPEHLDELFGTVAWREWEQHETPAEREDFLVGLYEQQLRSVAQFVWSFRMVDMKNQTSYYLVFGTNHISGLDKMKSSMWKVSPSGDYSFSDRHAHQMFLFGENPDLGPLRTDLLTTFSRQLVSIADLERNVLVKTNYLSSHLRNRTLAPMERDGLIEVPTPRNRRCTYPDGTRIRFKV